MPCAANIQVSSAQAVVVTTAGGGISVVTATSPDVVLQFRSSAVKVQLDKSAPLVIEVCKQGPQGPPGLADPVFVIKPDVTLGYDAADTLIRLDYADGTYKDLTYNAGGLLITVTGVNLTGDTVTKNLTYDGENLLISVSTVIS